VTGKAKVLAAFVASVVAMAVAGTVAQTQFVLSALRAAGATVSSSDLIAMSGADLVGFAPVYAAIIALGFAIAFLLAGFARRWVSLPRTLVFAAAGAGCIALMLYMMQLVFFGIPLIAGTRTAAGTFVQIGLGALAGALFASLSAPGNRRGPTTRSIAQ
jgi:hypothetical protein